jgi:hypothetical protein
MADALPIAEVVHAMPGRVRLRIAERRGNAVFFASVASGLSTIAGVYKVETRPLTGSVVIQHGPPLERIALAAQEARLFTVGNATSLPPPAAAAEFDPKLLVGLGLGALGLWQLTEGKVLPNAITLGWYAAVLTGLLSNEAAAEE